MVSKFMDLTDRQLELKLCETYFSIMNKAKTLNISLEELCSVSKISYNNAVKVIPADFIENYFFLKILISKIDNEVLDELKTEIIDDDVSTVYDKILEGITLRFEKFIIYKIAIQTLSQGLDKKINICFKLLNENFSFMTNLLKLVEKQNQNCVLQNIKSVALNLVFIKVLEKFLQTEDQDIDSIIGLIDKYLTEIQDLGFLFGFLKKAS